jgi:hypothetical protein
MQQKVHKQSARTIGVAYTSLFANFKQHNSYLYRWRGEFIPLRRNTNTFILEE